MQKKTHIAFGVFIGSIMFYFGIPLPYVILVGFMAFFPDIDWLMDKIWLNKNGIVKRIWLKVFKTKSIHRTFLHNIWCMIFLMVVLGYFSSWDLYTIISVFFGYISHLIMDSLTVSGVYWLWPYGFSSRKFFINGKFVTGRAIEKILFSIFIILGGLFFGLSFMKTISFKDVLESLITIVMLSLFGIALMKKIVRSLEKVTSKIFK